MTESERDRLVKLELMLPEIKKSLEKILENQEALTILKLEADANKKFRDSSDEHIKKLIDYKLSTTDFDDAISRQIRKDVKIIFNTDEVREDFVAKSKAVFNDSFKDIKLGLYLKISGIVATIASGVIIAWIQGLK